MTRSYLLTVLMCSTLFLAPNSAQAAIDVAGAEMVKKVIKSMLEEQLQAIKTQSPTVNFKMSGDYVVEPKETYYAVKTPHLIIQANESGQHKGTQTSALFSIDYGSTQINVMPGATADQWRMAVAVPSPIRMKMNLDIDCGTNKECQESKKSAIQTAKSIVFDTMEIHQKTTKFQMLWDDSQKMILKQDGLIEGFKIKIDGKDVPVTIGSLAWGSNATPGTPGQFDGTSMTSIKNIAFDLTGEHCPKPCKSSIKGGVGELLFSGNYGGYDHKMYRAFNQKMAEMMDAGYDQNKLPTPEAFAALWKDISNYVFLSIDKADGTFGVRDLSVSATDMTKAGAAPIVLGVKEVMYNGGIANWKSDKANMYLITKMSGLSFPNMAHELPILKVLGPYVPTESNDKLDIQNIPHKKLFEQLGAMAQNFMASLGPAQCAPGEKPEQCAMKGQSAQQMQMLGLQAMMTMPKLFTDAGTKVTYRADMNAPKFTYLVDGDFTANAAAMYSGIGKLKAVLGGLDALLVDIQTAAKDPTTKPVDAKTLADFAGMLTFAQMFGQQGTDAKGNPARIYDFVLDDKGAIKLNGADLSTFKNMGSPGTPSVPAAKTDAGKP